MDLDNLEAIIVHSSDDSEDDVEITPLKSDHVTPFFDYLPDEIVLNIYSHMTVKEVVRMSEVCWRFVHLLNEESFWGLKARRWEYLAFNEINLPKMVVGTSPKEWYVQKYKENLKREQASVLQREKEAKRLREEENRDRMFFFSKFIGVSFFEHGSAVHAVRAIMDYFSRAPC